MKTPRFRLRSVAAITIAGPMAALMLWWAVANARGEGHDLRYLLWREGLFPFDAAVVYNEMVGDKGRDQLVAGLTVAELERRFGKLRTADDATQYQESYANSVSDGEIRWLGDSHWLVVLKGGRVKELRLMKG